MAAAACTYVPRRAFTSMGRCRTFRSACSRCTTRSPPLPGSAPTDAPGQDASLAGSVLGLHRSVRHHPERLIDDEGHDRAGRDFDLGGGLLCRDRTGRAAEKTTDHLALVVIDLVTDDCTGGCATDDLGGVARSVTLA